MLYLNTNSTFKINNTLKSDLPAKKQQPLSLAAHIAKKNLENSSQVEPKNPPVKIGTLPVFVKETSKAPWVAGGIASVVLVAVAGIFAWHSHTFENALEALENGEYLRAKEGFETLSKLGHTEAQYQLGLLYANGPGIVRKDLKRAAGQFTKAARSNHIEASHKLGEMFEKGQGVSQDYSKAARLYIKAAQKNYANSQYRLAVLHEEGQGVEKNIAKTINYLESAAEQNYGSALFYLSQHYACGRGVAKDTSKAAEFMQKSLTVDPDQEIENLMPSWTWSKNCS